MASLYQGKGISDSELLRADLVTQALREPVMLMDLSLCITSWNSMCEAMCGKSAEKVLGFPFFALFPHAANNSKLVAALQHAKNGYASFLAAEDCRYTPGSFDNHFMPFKNGRDEVIGVMHTRHDIGHRLKVITDLERLNKKLAQKNAALIQWAEMLQMACRSIESFLYEPLSRIHSFAQILLTGQPATCNDGNKYLERIGQLANKSRAFTLRFMEYIIPVETKEPFTEIDLNQVFLLIRNNLQQEMDAAGATIQWEKLPMVKGDRRLLYLMFKELITNALNFRKDGTPLEIRVTGDKTYLELLSEDYPAVASYTWVRVSDNGIGFKKEHAAKLFRPFYKVLTHQPTQGYGIGLALCAKIVERHQGVINARATEAGSQFTCSFPA